MHFNRDQFQYNPKKMVYMGSATKLRIRSNLPGKFQLGGMEFVFDSIDKRGQGWIYRETNDKKALKDRYTVLIINN